MLARIPQFLKHVLRHHGVEVFAITLFCVCIWRGFSIRPLEDAIVPFVAALGGLICSIAPDEVSDCTGYYGWSTQQYRNYPPAFLRGLGVVVLIATAICIR